MSTSGSGGEINVTYTSGSGPRYKAGLSRCGRKVHAVASETIPACNNGFLDRSTVGGDFGDVPRRLRCIVCHKIYRRGD